MKLCRYDDDRLGVVRGDMVHDVTDAQTQIRAAAPYAMKGDAVIAALPAWRSRLEEMAAKAPGKPVSQVSLLAPVARPSKLVAAPTNYKAHIEEMAARETALDYVVGYSIGLDMTARGPEDRSFRKSIDTYSVLGPWLVTADEIPDPDNVPLSISVNGEVKQNSNTKQLIYDCRKLIEW